MISNEQRFAEAEKAVQTLEPFLAAACVAVRKTADHAATLVAAVDSIEEEYDELVETDFDLDASEEIAKRITVAIEHADEAMSAAASVKDFAASFVNRLNFLVGIMLANTPGFDKKLNTRRYSLPSGACPAISDSARLLAELPRDLAEFINTDCEFDDYDDM